MIIISYKCTSIKHTYRHSVHENIYFTIHRNNKQEKLGSQ